MKLPRRQFLHLAAGAAALPAVSRIARAQAYPSRPVRMDCAVPTGRANRHQRAADRATADVRRSDNPSSSRTGRGAGATIGVKAVATRGARRLHHSLRLVPAHSQSAPHFTPKNPSTTIRSSPSRRSNRLALLCRTYSSCRPAAAGQDRCRVHRLRQGQSGQDQRRLGRHRHVAPSPGRAVQDDDRRRTDVHVPYRGRLRRSPTSLSGQVAGHVRQPVHVAGAHQGRQAARCSAVANDRAIGDAARCADHRRDGAGL